MADVFFSLGSLDPHGTIVSVVVETQAWSEHQRAALAAHERSDRRAACESFAAAVVAVERLLPSSPGLALQLYALTCPPLVATARALGDDATAREHVWRWLASVLATAESTALPLAAREAAIRHLDRALAGVLEQLRTTPHDAANLPAIFARIESANDSVTHARHTSTMTPTPTPRARRAITA